MVHLLIIMNFFYEFRYKNKILLIKSTLRSNSSEVDFAGKSPTGVISSEFRASSSIKCQNHFFTLRR